MAFFIQHIKVLLHLLLCIKGIGTGNESPCDCNIRYMNKGTLVWVLSTQLCNTDDEAYMITNLHTASELDYILSCMCSSGQLNCRVKTGYNYSVEKNRITLTLKTSDEHLRFERLPSSDKCQCTFWFSAQVPCLPEDATTSTTRNPQQTPALTTRNPNQETTPTTSSTTSTQQDMQASTTSTTASTTPTQQDASCDSLWDALWAAIAVIIFLVVVIIVIVMCYMGLRKKLKEPAKENSEAQLHELSTNNPDIPIIMPEEVQSTRTPIPASTNDTTEELHARQPNNGNSHYQLPVPVAGASHVLPAATSSQPSAHCVPNHAYSVHGSHASTSASSVMPERSVDNATDQEEDTADDSQSEDNTLLTDAVKTRPEEQQAKGRYLTFSYSGETDA